MISYFSVSIFAAWFPELKLDGCDEVTFFDEDPGIAKTDLLLGITPSSTEDKVWLGLQYNTDIMDPTTITSMADNLLAILEAACSTPTTPLEQLDLVAESQRNDLLYGLQVPLEP